MTDFREISSQHATVTITDGRGNTYVYRVDGNKKLSKLDVISAIDGIRDQGIHMMDNPIVVNPSSLKHVAAKLNRWSGKFRQLF